MSPLPESVPNDSEATDFDPDTWETPVLTLASGGTGAGLFDAGFYTTGSVISSVWNDVDSDGIRDPQEGPFTGQMTVNVYPVGNNEVLVSTMTNQ